MKKFLITACIPVMVFTGCAVSQETGNALAGNIKSPPPAKPYINDINTRAMRDFVSRYKNVNDAIWHKSNDNYIAVFIRDSIQTRVIYNSHGDMEFVMRYYEEPNLRRDVRAVVKSVYYDYSIFIIQEIEKPDYPLVYIINLQDSTSWKKIRVCNGEMDVMAEFKKRGNK